MAASDDYTKNPMYDPVTATSDESKHVYVKQNYNNRSHIKYSLDCMRLIVGIYMCMYVRMRVHIYMYVKVCVCCMFFLAQGNFPHHVYSSVHKPNKMSDKPTITRDDVTKSSGNDELNTTIQEIKLIRFCTETSV